MQEVHQLQIFEEYWNGEINWVTLVDLPATDFISTINSTTRRITESGLKNSSAKILPINSILVSTRATIGRIATNNVECCTNQGFKNIIINDFKRANPIFVALMMTKLIDKMNSMATGGTFKELSSPSFKTLEIPLPPISVQNEIVAKIEGYQKIIDGAKMVVENYKPKIEIDPEWEMVVLGEVAKPEYGFTERAKDDGNARFIRITDIGSDGKLIETDAKYIDLTKEAEKSIVKRNDILLARTGATYGKTMIFEEDYLAVFASFLMRLNFNSNKVFPKYYWVFAQSENYLIQAASLMTGGGQPQFNGNAIIKIKIPLPPLEIQHQIVYQIEKEINLVNSNKSLIEIFEQKIKDRIAKVWGE